MAKIKDLTIKQRKFVKEYISNGGNGTKAVKKVYGTKNDNVAAVDGSNLLKNPKVQSTLLEAMEKIGINDKYLATKAKEGLNAKLTHFAQEKGIITDHVDCIDFNARHRYLETVHKLRGDFAPERIIVEDEEIDITKIDKRLEQLGLGAKEQKHDGAKT